MCVIWTVVDIAYYIKVDYSIRLNSQLDYIYFNVLK